MWLFSQRGFYSIVQHKDDPKLFVVKARVKGAIEKYWPTAVIERNEDYDYLYRANILRGDVERMVTKMVRDIDYTSFKGSLEDKRNYNWYVRVWEILCQMQDWFKAKEKTKETADGPSDRA